jgi:uncharacterized protein (DUF2141 family)
VAIFAVASGAQAWTTTPPPVVYQQQCHEETTKQPIKQTYTVREPGIHGVRATEI